MVGHRYPAHRCHGDCARNAVDRLTLGDCGAIAAAKQADLLLVDGNPGEPAAQVTEAQRLALEWLAKFESRKK